MSETAPAIVIERPRQAVVKDIAITPPGDDAVVIRTTHSAISTGTEMKVWSGLSGSLGGELWYPLVPGYEGVGRVERVGRAVAGALAAFKKGDRVMINEVRRYPDHCAAWGGQCALAVKDPRTAPAPFDPPALIPDAVSDEEAVLAYLAAVAEKGVRKAAPQAGETVLVIGLGLIGLSWVQLARLAGARVIALDIHPERLALGARFAHEVIDPRGGDAIAQLERLTGGRRADLVVECSGNPAVVADLPGYLRDGGWDGSDDGGRIHLQADYPAPLVITPYQRWFTKNLRLSMTCAIRPGGKEAILGLLAAKKFDLRTILESPLMRRVRLADTPAAYGQVEAARGSILKTLIDWR
jgi:2-desacetyl-2-hydroxyethyl bacteriochlorophyllide A dehydrogenase